MSVTVNLAKYTCLAWPWNIEESTYSCNFTALRVLILLSTGESSSQFSSEKLLCAVHRNDYRNPKLAKKTRLWSCPGPVDASTKQTLCLRLSECSRIVRKIVKCQRPRVFAGRLCLQYRIGKLHPGSPNYMVA